MSHWGLDGRAVLVTGAARGIGAETARRLAARGARVSLVGLEPAELERVAGECPGAVFFEADVTDPDALAAAVEGTVEARCAASSSRSSTCSRAGTWQRTTATRSSWTPPPTRRSAPAARRIARRP